MNIFETSINVTVVVSILYFCPATLKLYHKMLIEQGKRFHFIFSLTIHYQNDELLSGCSECDKILREIFDFSHKSSCNNCKGCLIRCYVKTNLIKFTINLKKTTVAT